MATIKTISSINTPSSAYQVSLIVNGARTIVNVFANSPAEAGINARNQVNPNNIANVSISSVTPINACSIASPIATTISSRGINNIGGSFTY